MRINPNNFIQGVTNTVGRWMFVAKERILSWLRPSSKGQALSLPEKISEFSRISLSDARK